MHWPGAESWCAHGVDNPHRYDDEALEIARHPRTLHNHTNLRITQSVKQSQMHALICRNTIQKSWEMPPRTHCHFIVLCHRRVHVCARVRVRVSHAVIESIVFAM